MASKNSSKHGSGVFDVRNIIGALLAIYGVVLVILGFVDAGSQQVAQAGGINSNLWTGIGLVVFAVLMFLWAFLRPIRPEEEARGSGDA